MSTAWAPLRFAAYRSLWLAILVSNVGSLMHTVGAQWLLVDEPGAATLVALVQTASMLPVLLLALPAGALADSLDRRRLLLVVQLVMFAIGVLITVLTAMDRMPPALLLALTFAFGVGMALTLPAAQALIPELVPREDLPAAAALGAISMNVARSVGPALAGIVIAQAGVATVFAANAVSFLAFVAVMVSWRRRPGDRATTPERFMPAVRAGGRYVRHSPVVRRILFRAALFVVPGSALWALLPLVASRNLGLESAGYGLLLASLGIGAIIGALVLPVLREALSPNRLLFAAGLAYGLALLILATVRHTPTVLVALLPAGMAWVVVLSTVNATMQLFLPGWVRARGLSIYQLVFAGGQALGSLAFGVLAGVTNLTVAYLAAGATMLAGATTVRMWPLRDVTGLSREPAVFWTEPQLTLEPEPDTGPVVVTVTYTVAPEREAEFVAQMQAVGRSRRRTGANRWGLFRAGEAEGTFVEVYLVASWEEHLRQHEGRLTGADQDIELRARELADGEPVVSHLLPARPEPTGPRGPEV